MMSAFRTVLQSTRAPFLLLTPVCVMLGATTVHATGSSIDVSLLALVLVGALLAHISVNTLNEYADFRSGLDLQTRRTPFSGGSGALPANPRAINKVFATSLVALVACLLIGVYLAWLLGPGIVPLGVLGAVLIVTYTEWINRSPLLCLLAPGLGFGLLMVAGTQLVLAGHYSPLPWIAGLLPFFLVNNLLLLNQYPDIEADRAAGRNHFPIAHGIRNSNIVYGLFVLAAAGVVIAGVAGRYMPSTALAALLPLPLALFSLRGAVVHGADIGQHPRYLGANVAATLLSPLLLGIAFISS